MRSCYTASYILMLFVCATGPSVFAGETIKSVFAIHDSTLHTHAAPLPLAAGQAEIEIYFYHSDQIGSTAYITDASGMVYQHLEYFPFGETFVEEQKNGSNADLSYRFNGKERDGETGLYYYGARYYDPVTSLWQSVDAMAGKWAGWTPYNFALNNPVKYIDPDGNDVYVIDKDKGLKKLEAKSIKRVTSLPIGQAVVKKFVKDKHHDVFISSQQYPADSRNYAITLPQIDLSRYAKENKLDFTCNGQCDIEDQDHFQVFNGVDVSKQIKQQRQVSVISLSESFLVLYNEEDVDELIFHEFWHLYDPARTASLDHLDLQGNLYRFDSNQNKIAPDPGTPLDIYLHQWEKKFGKKFRKNR